MLFSIEIKYFHPRWQISLENIRTAWLISDIKNPIKLKTDIHQGCLYFRLPGSGKRISYRSLKKGLTKKNIPVYLPVELLPF